MSVVVDAVVVVVPVLRVVGIIVAAIVSVIVVVLMSVDVLVNMVMRMIASLRLDHPSRLHHRRLSQSLSTSTSYISSLSFLLYRSSLDYKWAIALVGSRSRSRCTVVVEVGFGRIGREGSDG